MPVELKRGIVCPACGGTDFRTDKTIDLPGRKRRRYKICRHCGKHIRTVEVMDKPAKDLPPFGRKN